MSLSYENVLDNFKKLDSDDGIDDLNNYKESICSESHNLTQFIHDLIDGKENNEFIGLVLRVIAELAKNEKCRQTLSINVQLFHAINHHIKEPAKHHNIKIQVCRAIGNFFYENDNARLTYLNTIGLSDFLGLIEHVCQSDPSEISATLIEVLLGCFHNLTNDNDTLRNEFFKLNIWEHFKKLTKYYQTKNLNIIKYHLSSCDNLLELESGKQLFADTTVAYSILTNLNEFILLNLNEYTEDFFVFLDTICSLKNIKKQLCDSNFIDLLFSMMNNKSILSDHKDFMRKSGLFIAQLLVSDDDINDVIEYKSRFMLSHAIEWLNDLKNASQLHLTASVIIANYARSDADVASLLSNCNKPHINILKILKINHDCNEDIEEKFVKVNVVHSLLGALRNFCIPISHRIQLIEDDTINTVLPFLNWMNMEIKYKTLGIIRLLARNSRNDGYIDGLFESSLIEEVTRIAVKEDHPGAKGESSRLLCYLILVGIKFKRLEIIDKYLQCNSIVIIVEQLDTEHIVMVNEALLSLSVCSTLAYEKVSNKLKELKLDEKFERLFHNDQIPIEIQLNILKLFSFLVEKGDFFNHDSIEKYEKQLNAKMISCNHVLRPVLSSVIQLLNRQA